VCVRECVCVRVVVETLFITDTRGTSVKRGNKLFLFLPTCILKDAGFN
jgi:hypothetical protein